jgi:hypothetical protein
MGEWKQEGERQIKFIEVGESLEGVLVDSEESVLGVNYYHIQLEDGEIVGTLGSVGLDRLMEGIAIGSEVKIVFDGLAKTKGGQRFKNYKVFVKEA